MTVPLTMPRLGETVTEGTVIRWLKKEGDFVNKDENFVEISTAKIDTEVPSPISGRIEKILVPEDEMVPVGAELALVDETAAARAAAPEVAAEKLPVVAAPPAPAPPPAPTPAAAPEVAPAPVVAAPAAPPAEEAKEIGFVSPIVRKLAREHNVDLTAIKGTGAGGRITKQDVEQFIETQKAAPAVERPPIAMAPMPAARVPEREIPGAPAVAAEQPTEAPAPPPAAVGPAAPEAIPAAPAAPPAIKPAAPVAPAPVPEHPGERIVPIPVLRREIAEHMVRSRRTSAHVTAIVEVDMTNVVQQRAKVKDKFKSREGFSLTYLPFVAKATIDALISFPTVNASIVDEHHMALHDYINLGIAVAVENGLIVPVVKHAEEMNLIGLAHNIHEQAEKTRTGKISIDDVTGATFTITNPGSFGSLIQTPIINQPNVAILSLEMIQKRPVVIDDAIAIRHMVFMPLSYDHRLIDGAVAAQFLNRVKTNLETWDFSPDLVI